MYGLLGDLEISKSKKGLLSLQKDVLFAIWEPLARQTRPIQRMGNNNVVKIRSIFLPLSNSVASSER